jgi:hypothetical protein
MLCGLLPEFSSAPEMTGDIRKSRSSLLKHIFSTIPAFTPSSTQHWVCTRSGCQEWLSKKFNSRSELLFRLQHRMTAALNKVPPGNPGSDRFRNVILLTLDGYALLQQTSLRDKGFLDECWNSQKEK